MFFFPTFYAPTFYIAEKYQLFFRKNHINKIFYKKFSRKKFRCRIVKFIPSACNKRAIQIHFLFINYLGYSTDIGYLSVLLVDSVNN